MRFLDPGKMLAMLPADKSEEQQALDRYKALLSPLDKPLADRLPTLTENGFLQTCSVRHEGEPVAVFWYRVESERLIVDTLIGIGKGRTTEEAFESIWAGVEQLGRARGCNAVEGVTKRSALAKVYLDHGFKAEGVLMRKAI